MPKPVKKRPSSDPNLRAHQMMAEHTGQPIEVIERDTDRDNFMGADDAVKYGLIDRVLKNRLEAVVV